ncbi:GNAT family N-acetyltransferase [Bacillus marasmi]|uniref:GNAT family N-acetyltransferase n=1 Tax=Bacillus marasmi TaxID=1926279 RepID=UPI0011CB4C20|nr:GNAT family N-acetyltransferase [Bacillus marasmi]
MIFEPVTELLIELALEIVNSNRRYNILENGHPIRSIEEVRKEFLNPNTESFLILYKNEYIGLIDFLANNPNDNHPWLGLLMIHKDYHSLGYGKMAYAAFEEKLKQENYDNVRIGVLQKNLKAQAFWKSLGFEYYGESTWEGKVVNCFEKNLMDHC